ncbi:hypothetical protein KA005_26080, partial [bacterium]|nr:hypothetical protein [bacterium]
MRKLPFKKLILGATLTITIAAGVFLFSGIVYAEDKPQYVPDEIIVKFKAEAARTLEQQIIKEKRAQSEVSLAASLDKLNKKYKVKEFKQIFPNFKKNQKRLEALKKKDVSLLTKKEKHLLKRLKRGPKDAKTPALDRIYKLELEEGQSVEEAVAEYSQDPNVEYAQPNYIYQLYATPLPPEPYIPNDYYVEDPGLYDPVMNTRYWREGSWGQDYPDLWGLGGEQTDEGWRYGIQAIEAWNIFDTDKNGMIDGDENLPGEGIIVAVIDSGVDYNHEDIQANIWQNDGEIPGNDLDDDENGYIDDIRGYD